MSRQVPVTLPEGYLEFYKNLETWQNQQQFKLQRLIHSDKTDVIKLLSNSSKPLLKHMSLIIDPDQFQNLYVELLDYIPSCRPESAQTVAKLKGIVSNIEFKHLLSRMLDDDYTYLGNLAVGLDVPQELFIFSLEHALRPFLRVYAEPVAEDIKEDTFQYWDFPDMCPFCGAKSRICRLRSEDGRRFMFCDRCFTEWEVRALYCVHCGNDEVGTIRYLSLENDPAYQIYVCDKCKGYIKTYDERKKAGAVDLFIANVETVYLDMVAEENGFKNHTEDGES
ncbi:MAG: formate dehydrogenase accessory protein FdhE [Syntrophomonadaceae bacterium]|jgi:FdhE protein